MLAEFIRDAELHDKSPFYRARHWLRDGGWEIVARQLFVSIVMSILITLCAVMCYGIYLYAQTYHSHLVHVIDKKR